MLPDAVIPANVLDARQLGALHRTTSDANPPPAVDLVTNSSGCPWHCFWSGLSARECAQRSHGTSAKWPSGQIITNRIGTSARCFLHCAHLGNSPRTSRSGRQKDIERHVAQNSHRGN